MDLLAGWYPGLGEVEKIRRMSPLVREFISGAVNEDPGFLEGYLLPVLDRPDSEEIILGDLSDAVMALELSESGLGSYDENLGNLGKSFFKKVAKTVKKVAQKVVHYANPVTAVKAAKEVEKKVVKAIEKTAQKVGKTVSKAWTKYGNIFLQVAGMVLAPFTGGASLAIAAALTAGNTYYAKKRAADRAKQAASRDAGQLTAEADQARAQAEQEVNAFYSQNQQWFVDNLGLTPDKWAQLTFEQKIDILKNASQGRPPGAAPPPEQPVQGPPAGGGYAPPPSGGGSAGGGGGGGGGLFPEGTSSGGGFAPAGGQQGQQVATASMFDSSMLPLLAVGAGLALIFGKSVKGGGRRTKRNPGRRRRRAA